MTEQQVVDRAKRIADLLDDLDINDAMDVHRAACEPIIYRRVPVGAGEILSPDAVGK